MPSKKLKNQKHVHITIETLISSVKFQLEKQGENINILA